MDEPLYNSIVIKNYLEYLRFEHPHVNIRELLDDSGIADYEVEDGGHWFTQTQINRFHEYLSRETGNPNISRLAGRYVASPKATGFASMRRFVMAFLSPAAAYWAVEKLSPFLTRHMTVHSKHLDSNKVEVVVTTHPYVKEESFQCENRLGVLEAIAQIFTGRYATVEHPECLHKDAGCCRYIISWEPTPSQRWKKAGYFFLAGSVLTSFPFLFLFSFPYGLINVLSAFLLSVCLLLYGSAIQNREMAAYLTQQGKASEELIEQINLRYNESLLIQEIGEAASTLLDLKTLLAFITERINTRLSFHRSMIMLSNPERTKLIYSAGHGFTPYEETLLRNITFDPTDPKSSGFFYRVYVHQKPVIVGEDDLSQLQMSEKNFSLVRDLGLTSFICVPIIYEKVTEGILAVDMSKPSSPPRQSDVSLLIGIAQHIGVSLNNAAANKKMHENGRRFLNLSENSSDVIYQLNPDGMIRYVNPAWEDILGHPQGEFILS